MVAHGPDSIEVRSMMRIPSSGPMTPLMEELAALLVSSGAITLSYRGCLPSG
jgi:hypothetical protein